MRLLWVRPESQILVVVIHHFFNASPWVLTSSFQKPAIGSIGSSSIRSLRCQFYAFTHREARVLDAAVIWPPGLHIIVSKNGDAPNGPIPVFSSELVHFVALLLGFSNVLTCLQRIFRYSWLNSGWRGGRNLSLSQVAWKWLRIFRCCVSRLQTHPHIISRCLVIIWCCIHMDNLGIDWIVWENLQESHW